MAIGTTEMDVTTESLNELLEIEGELIEKKNEKSDIVESNESQIVETDTDTNKDYNYARDNMYEIIENGQTALEELMTVAKNSQHPRAYEVLQQTVKTLVEANEKLLVLQKQRQELEEKKGNKTMKAGLNVEQAVFVGNTSDLQRLIDNQKKKNE